MKLYITFGQVHAHVVNGKTFDKDSVACIECTDYANGREKAFDYFGPKFATSYTEEEIQESLHYYPRGIIDVGVSDESN